MRRALFALVSAAILPVAAHAITVDNFTLTGTQSNSNPFSLSFQLPSSYTAPSNSQQIFSTVPITVNGVFNETGTITIDTTQFLIITLNDSAFDNFAVNTTNPFEALSNNTDTFIAANTNSGATYIDCSVKLIKPRPAASPILAAVQFPTFSLTCPAVSNLAINQGLATAPTPEPASFTLLLLGGLAPAGTLCRRIRRMVV